MTKPPRMKLKSDIDAEYLRSVLDYTPDDGVFRWKVSFGNKGKVGSVAGCVNFYGYVVIRVKTSLYMGHRLAWLYMTGAFPTCFIDHIDGDRANNRWGNLREATSTQNHWNMKRSARNTSGFKGVSFHKAMKAWSAVIKHGGKVEYLGCYPTPELAHEAYVNRAKEVFGEYARAA